MKDLGSCPSCGGAIAEKYRKLQVWECSRCGLAFRNPMPHGSDELDELYARAWERPEANVAETGTTDLELARIYVERLEGEMDVGNLTNVRVLDFGAGTGAMTGAMGERRADVYSVDPFSFDLLATQGLKAYRSLEDLPADVRFHGAVAVEVIEHLPRPADAMKEIFDRLSDEGWLYVSTPNARGLNARLSRARWREFTKRGHLYFFDAKSLESLLEQVGFRPRRITWEVAYHRGPRALLHKLLVLLRLDGALRVLAVKPGPVDPGSSRRPIQD